LLKGEYVQNGDDLIIRGDLGEEITVEGYFSGDTPPVLETTAGAMLHPDTVQKLLINTDSIDVAGPAGSISIPGLLGDPIGTIDEMGGDVTAKGADGVIRTLQEGDPIYQNDLVETVGRSYANLRMVDDTSFQLGKETRAIIENYSYTPGVESGQFEATVVSGFFRYASGSLGGLDKGTHTTIKTPTAQIGVRGSEMEGVVESDGSSTFVHKEGILDVSDANGRGTVTLDQPGMATAVSIRPGAPEPAFDAPDELTKVFEEALPPVPDFVVAANEEEEELVEELLEIPVEGEGEEEVEVEAEEVEAEEFELESQIIEEVIEEETQEAVEARVNLSPEAVADNFTGKEDVPLLGTLAANDQLGDGTHVWALASDAQYGTVTVNRDGTFTYQTRPEYEHYNGEDRFTYTVRDADGDESTATVTLNLTAQNDAPTVQSNTGNIDLGSQNSDPSTVEGTLTWTDPDANDVLTANIVSSLESGGFGDSILGSFGTLVLNGDGSYTYIADQDKAKELAVGVDGIDTFTYTITDQLGESSSATLTITVTGMNDAPTVSSVLDGAIELPASSISGTLTWSDPDHLNDDLTANIGSTNKETTGALFEEEVVGEYGSLVLKSTGEYTYTPNGTTAKSLPADGVSYYDTFTYTLTDADGGVSTEATIKIAVKGANDAPVAVFDDSVSVTEADTAGGSGNVIDDANSESGVDSDPDTGTTLTVNGVRSGKGSDTTETLQTVNGTGETTITTAYGTLTISSDGSYTYVADQASATSLTADDDPYIDIFTYQISDGTEVSQAELKITVNGVGAAPNVTTTAANTSFTEGATTAVGLFTLDENALDAGVGDSSDNISKIEFTITGVPVSTDETMYESLVFNTFDDATTTKELNISKPAISTEDASMDIDGSTGTVSYSAVRNDESVTVTLTSTENTGWSIADAQTLVESLKYASSIDIVADEDVTRDIQLNYIEDSSGENTSYTDDTNKTTLTLLPNVSLEEGVSINEGAASPSTVGTGVRYFTYDDSGDNTVLGGSDYFKVSVSFLGSTYQNWSSENTEKISIFSYFGINDSGEEVGIYLDPKGNSVGVKYNGGVIAVEDTSAHNLFDGNLHAVEFGFRPSTSLPDTVEVFLEVDGASGNADAATSEALDSFEYFTELSAGEIQLGLLATDDVMGVYYDVAIYKEGATAPSVHWTMDADVVEVGLVTSEVGGYQLSLVTVGGVDSPKVVNTLLVQEDIDLSVLVDNDLLSSEGKIEHIDLRNNTTSGESVMLTAKDVVELTDDSNTLYVFGDDAGDSVTISDATNWNSPTTEVLNGTTFAKYTTISNDPVTLYVDLANADVDELLIRSS